MKGLKESQHDSFATAKPEAGKNYVVLTNTFVIWKFIDYKIKGTNGKIR